jgi:SAM-dependent methyltransferase
MSEEARQCICHSCGSMAKESAFHVREMMFNTGETFTYQRCAECASLTLRDPPAEIEPYYPDSYYSFGEVNLQTRPGSSLHKLLRIRSKIYSRVPEHLLRSLIYSRTRALHCPSFVWWLSGSGISVDGAVCDVGTGNGDMLAKMSRHGFTNLTGIDPFMTGGARTIGPIRLLPSTIEDVDSEFDLVMFNHSLEHIADPVTALCQARDRLREGGMILVRVPVADSYADRRFGPYWVGIDAPRHCFIPSVRGMKALARRSGLRVQRIFFDSDELQFSGSMLYQRGIPLTTVAKEENPGARVSRERENVIRSCSLARGLNACGLGDTAGFQLVV